MLDEEIPQRHSIVFNPCRPDSGRKEKINLNFYFHFFCGASKGFMKRLS